MSLKWVADAVMSRLLERGSMAMAGWAREPIPRRSSRLLTLANNCKSTGWMSVALALLSL